MMRPKKKGLDDSIWASRGKSSNFYGSPPPSTYHRPSQPNTSIIIPATPQPPSEAKNGSRSPTKHSSAEAPAAATAKKPNPSSQQEFKRYIQIVRRLKWKLPYLSHGYHHAIAKPGDPLYGGETNAQEAELMFKLDFYEYYMLLERALVHLLGVFGITVPRDAPPGERWATAAAARGGGAQSAHTYHENVIAALQREDNPLHEALGTGEVLFCLSRAKELRNRWKYAEEISAGRRGEEPGRERAGTAPLESYDLDRIFVYVFAGFDAGYAAADRRVAQDVGEPGVVEAEVMEVEEDEYDFMVEAMDWEAV